MTSKKATPKKATAGSKPTKPEASRPASALTGGNLGADRRAQLHELFPEAHLDGILDADALLQFLSTDDETQEGYGFQWVGKRDSFTLAHLPSVGTLNPDVKASEAFDTTGNVFIEGENLEVLKLLYRGYYGQARMIYIDPPYNTKKDFIYVDRFADPLKAYLEKTGQKSQDGTLLTSNPETGGRYHSTWLSMMYPRLVLAFRLLRDDGVLLISCNDIEQAHLKLVLHEIFGEENFVTTFIWHNQGNIDQQSKVKENHEFIHCYARSKKAFERPVVIDPNIEEDSKLFLQEIENTITKNGPANPMSKVLLPAGFPAAFESGTIAKRTNKFPHYFDDATIEDSELQNDVVVESGWSSRNLLKLFIDNGFVPVLDNEGRETRFAITETGTLQLYKKRADTHGHVLSVLQNMGTAKKQSAALKRWGIEWDFPKPVMLIKYLTSIFTEPGDLVVDFFGGSGTTAEAVMELDAEGDATPRRFVLVELPEPTPADSPARKNGFKTLSAVSLERIKKAAGAIGSKRQALGVAGVQVNPDLGVRVFRLTSSNYRRWAGSSAPSTEAYLDELALFADPLVDGWKPEAVLWEVALKEGMRLDSEVSQLDAVGKRTWRLVGADSRSLVVSLESKVPVDIVNLAGITEDDVLVCLDSALTDTLAANLALQCNLKTV